MINAINKAVYLKIKCKLYFIGAIDCTYLLMHNVFVHGYYYYYNVIICGRYLLHVIIVVY